MSSRPTIKDIAAEAGVALGTASRALSGNGSIAAETRERMLAAAERLDFIPNTETMGLLIPDVRNPFFAELAHVVEREVRSSGLSVRLCNADEDPDLMRECTFGLTVGASASPGRIRHADAESCHRTRRVVNDTARQERGTHFPVTALAVVLG